jgi:hypothetical protein
MKRFVILMVASVLVTAVAGILAGMGAGACHCSTPPNLLFPFGMILENGPHDIASVALLGRFPAYGAVLGLTRGRRATSGAALILVVLDVAAASVAVSSGKH